MKEIKLLYNNDGRSWRDTKSKVERIDCEICGAIMTAERNRRFSVAANEAPHVGRKDFPRRDRFTCPNLSQDWHRQIIRHKNEINRILWEARKIIKEM